MGFRFASTAFAGCLSAALLIGATAASAQTAPLNPRVALKVGAIALSADEARDCSESTYNPRLFKLLWTYYESKVALPAAESATG